MDHDNQTVHVNSPTQKVSRKAKIAGMGSYLAGMLALGAVSLLTDGSVTELVPDPYMVFLGPIVPGIVATLSAYAAKNNARDVNSPGRV